MNAKQKLTLFVSILISARLLSLSDAYPTIFGTKIHMNVTNMLDAGTALVISCFGRPSELEFGEKVVSFEQSWEFSFLSNIWRHKFVFCNLQWDGKDKNFPIFMRARDLEICNGRCWWHIKKEKPCMMNWTSGEFDHCRFYAPFRLDYQ